MIAYSSGRSKTFPVANSQWKSSISFLQKNIFNEKKKISKFHSFPSFLKAPLWKVLGTQKHGMLQQMSQAIKLLPLNFFHGDRSNKKFVPLPKKCWKKNLWSKRPLLENSWFFAMNQWITCFPHLFPSAASGSEKEPTVTATATAASGPAARGDGDLWGAGSTNKPTCVVLGSKIFTTRSPFSSNVCLGVSKKKTWPNLRNSGVSWIPSLQKVSWQVLWGSHTLGSRIFFPECSQKWLVGTNITFGFLQQQFWYLTVWQSLQKNSLTQHWTARHTQKIMSHLITFMNLSILSDFWVATFCTSGSLSVLKVLDALKGKSEVSEAPKMFFGNPFRTGVRHLESRRSSSGIQRRNCFKSIWLVCKYSQAEAC